MRALLWLGLVGCGRIAFDAAPTDGRDPDARADASVLVDGAPADTPTAVPCGPNVLLADTFDDGTAAPGFAASAGPGLTTSEAGGRFAVQFAPTVMGPSYAFYRSVAAYPATALCATVDVAQLPANDGAIYVKLRTAQLEIELYGAGGLLEMRTRQGNTTTVYGTVPLDLATHRYWRLQQRGATTSWQTSQDGVQFAVHATLDGFFLVNNCQFELGGGAFMTVTNGGTAAFEMAELRGG